MRRDIARRGLGRVAVVAVGISLLAVGCSDDEPEVGSFCDELRQVPSLASVLTGFADQDPERLDARLDEAATQYADLRESAPEVIAPDVASTVDLVDALIAAVRSDRDDPVEAAAGVRKVIGDHPEAETSGLAVADYARTECDVELNPGQGADGDAEAGGAEGEVPPAETGEDGSVSGGM